MRDFDIFATDKSANPIKFAWVCRNIHFNTIERVELTDIGLLTGNYPSWITSSNCEILAKIRPTGLKDKNGREIYEADIIKGETDRWKVVWDTEDAGFVMESLDMADIAGIPIKVWIGHAPFHKVIGNVWQNPELLEDK
jgi:hypothetical protein